MPSDARRKNVRAGLAVPALAAATLALVGCNTPTSVTSHTIAPTTMNAPVEGRAALERPIELEGHDVVLIPFVKETGKGWFEREDPFEHSRSRRHSLMKDGWLDQAAPGVRNGARYAAVDVRWHNAFGRDLSSRGEPEQWMLLDRRGVISSIALLTPPRSNDQSVYRVLYVATTEDTNGDGTLDSRDARRAWIADGDGRNPRVVTPEGLHVVRAWIDWERDMLYVRLLEDSDGDRKFTDADESAPWMLHLGGASPAQPLVDEQTVARARALLGG
ncbi:MAG: hypothetical protein ACFCBV_12575 [Phycisphaerales bacterium]